MMKSSLKFAIAAIAFISASNSIYGYGGTAHGILAKESLKLLKKSNPVIFDFYRSIGLDTNTILIYAKEPDDVPAGDASFQANFETAVNSIIDKYFFSNPFAEFASFINPIKSKISRESLKAVISKAISFGATSSSTADYYKMAQCATQHTYVYDPAFPTGNARLKAINDVGVDFSYVCKAPQTAEGEYTQARSFYAGGYFSMSARQLGRVMHYLQDITIPHHCEIPGNWPDVVQAATKAIGGTTSYDGLSAGSSQTRYEVDSCGAFLTNAEYLASALVRWNGLFVYPSMATNVTIANTIISTRNKVFSANWLDYVNGIGQYNKGSYKPATTFVCIFPPIFGPPAFKSMDQFARWAIYPGNVHIAGSPSGDCSYPFAPRSSCSQSIDYTDNFSQARESCMPIALNLGAWLLYKFYIEMGSPRPLSKKGAANDNVVATFNLMKDNIDYLQQGNSIYLGNPGSRFKEKIHIRVIDLMGRTVESHSIDFDYLQVHGGYYNLPKCPHGQYVLSIAVDRVPGSLTKTIVLY